MAFFEADTLYHAVTLTFYPLISKTRGTSSSTWSHLYNAKTRVFRQ